MTEREQVELEHALGLLREISPKWDGRVSVVPIDGECKFLVGQAYCHDALEEAVALLDRNLEEVHILALCGHHARLVRRAVDVWRARV